MDDNKDIYELFNDMDFEVTKDIKSNDLDELSKSRLKKKFRNSRKKKSNKMKIAVMVASIALVSIPFAEPVISEIRDKYFYTEGTGIVSSNNKDIYKIMEPIIYKDTIVKNILITDSNLEVGLWVNAGDEKLINEDYIYIENEEGERVNFLYEGVGCGGENSYISLTFNIDEGMTKFNLVIDGESKEINLLKVKTVNDYKEIGEYSESSGIILGVKTYEMNGKTYVPIWDSVAIDSNGKSYVSNIYKDDIEIVDSSGRRLRKEYSSYSGSSIEFEFTDDVKGAYMNISKVEIGYSIKEKDMKALELPKEGEIIEINERVKIDDLGEITIKSIEREDNLYKIIIGSENFGNDNIKGVIARLSRNGAGAIGFGDGTEGEINIEREDLTLKEKLIGKLNFEIDSMGIEAIGDWSIKLD